MPPTTSDIAAEHPWAKPRNDKRVASSSIEKRVVFDGSQSIIPEIENMNSGQRERAWVLYACSVTGVRKVVALPGTQIFIDDQTDSYG